MTDKCYCVWCRKPMPALSVTQEGQFTPQGDKLFATGICFGCHALLAQMHRLAYATKGGSNADGSV